jgi:hypothetical protein
MTKLWNCGSRECFCVRNRKPCGRHSCEEHHIAYKFTSHITQLNGITNILTPLTASQDKSIVNMPAIRVGRFLDHHIHSAPRPIKLPTLQIPRAISQSVQQLWYETHHSHPSIYVAMFYLTTASTSHLQC